MMFWVVTVLVPSLAAGWVGAALHEAYYQRIEHNKVYDYDEVK